METSDSILCEFRGSLIEIILSEGLEVPSYEDYLVFKEGFILSKKNGKFRILRPSKTGYKRHYCFVNLCKNGTISHFYVHRLVADAFIPNPDPTTKTQINHIDGNADNNHYSNLEWVTPKENTQHAFRLGLSPSGSDCPWAKLPEAVVHNVCKMLEDGRPLREIRQTNGIGPKILWKIRHRKQWCSISSAYNF